MSKNLFLNCARSLAISMTETPRHNTNITFCYNICQNTGITIDGPLGINIKVEAVFGGDKQFDGLYFYNNVFSSNQWMDFNLLFVVYPGFSSCKNVYIINNVIENALYSSDPNAGWLYCTTGCENFHIENNIIYNNSHNNAIAHPENIINLVFQNNLNLNPLFVNPGSDFHLMPSSSAINAGCDVGLLNDYDDNPIVGLPDIGAFEYIGDQCKILSFFYNNISAIKAIVNKTNLYSVRLLRDSTSLSHGQTGTYIGNDGRAYKTICIGTQEWLVDNLAETKYRNGDVIPEVTSAWDVLTTGALCAYNNDWNNV